MTNPISWHFVYIGNQGNEGYTKLVRASHAADIRAILEGSAKRVGN